MLIISFQVVARYVHCAPCSGQLRTLGAEGQAPPSPRCPLTALPRWQGQRQSTSGGHCSLSPKACGPVGRLQTRVNSSEARPSRSILPRRRRRPTPSRGVPRDLTRRPSACGCLPRPILAPRLPARAPSHPFSCYGLHASFAYYATPSSPHLAHCPPPRTWAPPIIEHRRD